MSLAVKYRPQTLDDMISQSSVIKILKKQLATNTVKNVYLFSGSSGCGKTTAARAFARAINNNVGTPIEIDAASNNGVDNIRALNKSAQERALDCTYKVIIIDECHALTNQSWQALLKTIEEPPKYTIFILCTTDPQKIPATIMNRVMRFNFNRIPSEKIFDRLCYISKQEGYTNYTDACDYISRICNGEMRAGIAYLEKCADYDNNITIENTLQALGNYSYDTYFDLIDRIVDGSCDKTIDIINNLYLQGNDMKLFVDQFLSFCLDVNKYLLFKDFHLTKVPASYTDRLKFSTGFNDANKYYQYFINKLLTLKNMLKTDNDPKSTIEVVFLQMCDLQ